MAHQVLVVTRVCAYSGPPSDFDQFGDFGQSLQNLSMSMVLILVLLTQMSRGARKVAEPIAGSSFPEKKKMASTLYIVQVHVTLSKEF